MKKAFVSYSLVDAELYVLSILAQRLKEQSYYLVSNYNNFSKDILLNVKNEILSSELFIGIITATGNEFQRVQQEWQFALDNRIQAVLLVENTVQVHESYLNHPNIVRFNRNNPDFSVQTVKQNIQNDNATAWVVGGLALLALIGLFSSKK